MAADTTTTAAAPATVKHTLIERVAVPVLFLVIGYGIGFLQGNSRGKRKSSSTQAG